MLPRMLLPQAFYTCFAILAALSATVFADDKALFDRLLPLAEAGDAQAQYELAQLYRYSTEARFLNPKRAEDWLIAASKQDHLPAIVGLLELYQGADFGAHPTQILELLERAATLGDIGSMHKAGMLLWQGDRNMRPDRPRALKFLRAAAGAGETEAIMFLANECLEGAGALRDEATARKLLEAAASEGNVAAAIYLHQFTSKWYRLPRLRLAVRSLEKLAKNGDAQAMLLLGRAHETGTGIRDAMPGEGSVAAGFADAQLWYQKAALAGNAEAEARLGVLYSNGVTASRNPKAALACFVNASAKGNSLGQLNLAVSILRGEHKDPNPLKALELLTAAAATNTDAAFELGMLYYEGNGVTKDIARAHELFLKAAGGNNPNAMVNLGVIAYNGEIGAGDRALADHWWRLAAARGSPDAQRFLKATAQKLTPAEIAASAAHTKAWSAAHAEKRLAKIPAIALRS